MNGFRADKNGECDDACHHRAAVITSLTLELETGDQQVNPLHAATIARPRMPLNLESSDSPGGHARDHGQQDRRQAVRPDQTRRQNHKIDGQRDECERLAGTSDMARWAWRR